MQSQQANTVEPVSNRRPQPANPAELKGYRRIVLLTDGYSTPFLAKTAISLLRYRTGDIAAVFDREHVGKDSSHLFGEGVEVPAVPVVDALPADADAVFIGIAPPGGKLPETWRTIIAEAIRRGIDVVSGLHDFIGNDQEFVALSESCGTRLVDVRRNSESSTATAEAFRDGCLRIHSVGQDCSVGKMVATLEVQRELADRGVDAHFLATGQTGIMISGGGIPIDCVVADFVSGAAESLVRANDHHDVVLIEGQGSISHPSFSAVTLGLLHGCSPHGLIYCYEVGRDQVKGLNDVPLLPAKRMIEAYEMSASLRHPCKVIGVGMNSRRVSSEEAEAERKRMEDELGLPVCDVYRDGAGRLADAVNALRGEVFA